MTKKTKTTLPGVVDKIIESPLTNESDKAQITVEGAEHLYRELRIDNSLTDEKGREVGLKPGAKVEVTVEADSAATTHKPKMKKRVDSATNPLKHVPPDESLA